MRIFPRPKAIMLVSSVARQELLPPIISIAKIMSWQWNGLAAWPSRAGWSCGVERGWSPHSRPCRTGRQSIAVSNSPSTLRFPDALTNDVLPLYASIASGSLVGRCPFRRMLRLEASQAFGGSAMPVDLPPRQKPDSALSVSWNLLIDRSLNWLAVFVGVGLCLWVVGLTV